MNLSELFGKVAANPAEESQYHAPPVGRPDNSSYTHEQGVHRGVNVVLPKALHDFVHDPDQPAPARAHLLLSEVKKQTAKNEGPEGEDGSVGGLGNYWSPSPHKAAEYADQAGFRAYRDHEREHNCGDEETGMSGCPTTHVVVHADTPSDEHHWHEEMRPGEKYDPEISWRLPVRPGAPVGVRGISWRQGNDHLPDSETESEEGRNFHTKTPFTRYDFSSQVAKEAGGLKRTVAAEDYAKQDGEDWYDHENRVMKGLSLGHVTPDEAAGHGFHQGRDWSPMPESLYHTTTNLPGVQEHGLKSGHELGYKNGQGLGGTPQFLSMTDREDHAHGMLHALHEYHDHLNGKTTYQDLLDKAKSGEGAQQPFHQTLVSDLGRHNEHMQHSILRDKRLEPGIITFEDAAAKGWTPHPTAHRDFGEGKDGTRMGSGWERPASLYEKHDEYGTFSRLRDWDGKGPKSILFVSNDREAFAKKDPSHFGVVKARPKPGAHGVHKPGEHEWRTGTGDAVEVHGEPIRRQGSAPAEEQGHGPHTVDLDGMDPWHQPGETLSSIFASLEAGANGPLPKGVDNEGHPVEMTKVDGWAHLDGSHGHEDNTNIGDHDVYTKDRTWLPHGRYWGPNSAQNDQRLFDGDHLRPEVRSEILGRINGFMRPRYKEWPSWTKVYFAGSEAAKWQPFNGDFDVLMGADFDKFRSTNAEYDDQSDEQIATMITDGMWHSINVDGYWFKLKDGREVGPFDRTFFMNPQAYDIRKLKPYAAYDVSDDSWAVHPLEVPENWDAATDLPKSYWGYAEAVLNEVKAIGTLPPEERHRMAANLYEELHTHRSDAFNGDGKGLYDLSNVLEKYLDQHPDKPWAKLVQWKSEAPTGASPWVPTTARRTTLTQIFSTAKKEPEGADYDGIMVAIVPPKSVGKKLLVEGGEPLDALHVTLAYLGSSKEHTKDQMDGLTSLVEAWARTQKPFEAKVGGVGTFTNPGKHVLMVHVDIPGGGEIRHSLDELLQEHDYKVRNDHGWTPHITLKYHTSHVRFLPKVEPVTWDVKEIMLCIGGNWSPIRLGG